MVHKPIQGSIEGAVILKMFTFKAPWRIGFIRPLVAVGSKIIFYLLFRIKQMDRRQLFTFFSAFAAA